VLRVTQSAESDTKCREWHKVQRVTQSAESDTKCREWHKVQRENRTSESSKQEVIDYFEATDILNPVYMMAFSGARGNISQVRQLVGMSTKCWEWHILLRGTQSAESDTKCWEWHKAPTAACARKSDSQVYWMCMYCHKSFLWTSEILDALDSKYIVTKPYCSHSESRDDLCQCKTSISL